MKLLVSTLTDIDFNPSSEVAEIVQNVQTIISTIKGTVPLDRDFGIESDFIDNPTPMAQMQCRVSIIDAVKTYEPRARVKSIDFKQGADDVMDGRLLPIVTIEIEAENER